MKQGLPPEVELSQVDIWFQDETRVGQQGSVTRLWAEKGTRPRALRQQQYEYTYLFGAVCPQRDEAVGVGLPWVNTEAMAVHLQAISAAVPEGRHAVVVVDGAGWHTQAALEGLSNVSLLSLPPASPELNPGEQVWQWLRQHTLANRCLEPYEAILEACCEAWNAFTSTGGTVKGLCSRQWTTLEP